MADILIIEFPGFTGGNHLANLLSLGENVHPPKMFRIGGNYKKYVISHYNQLGTTAHIPGALSARHYPKNADDNVVPVVFEDKFNILTTHGVTDDSMEFFNLHNSQKISLVSDNQWTGHRTYAPEGMICVEDSPYPLTDNIQSVYSVQISKWCSMGGIDELELMNSTFSLGLDLQLCAKLHSLWYNKIWNT